MPYFEPQWRARWADAALLHAAEGRDLGRDVSHAQPILQRRYGKLMEGPMTKDQVEAILARVPTWPDDRQQELAELALEIEAELAGDGYEATPDELTAIDEGLAGEAASKEEIKAAFASFRQT